VPIFLVASFLIFVQRKIFKNSKKIKSLIPTSAFGKFQEKFKKKEKFGLFAWSVSSFYRPLLSPRCATSRHVLASSCDLYFGSGLNNCYSAFVNCSSLLSYCVPTHSSTYSSVSTSSSCNCYPRSTTDYFATLVWLLFGVGKNTGKTVISRL
jgi:hypothetical protein